MLGSLSKLFSQAVDKPLNDILGLGGLTKYIFLIGSIGVAGGVIAGSAGFFVTVFDMAVTSVVPGFQVIGEQAVAPALETIFNVASAAFENPELVPNGLEPS